jgi:hypothetical protein
MALGAEGFAMRIRLGMIFLVVIGLSALASCSSDNSTPVIPTSTGASGSIEFISDQIIVFTEPGEGFHLAAVVLDDNGNVDASAKVSWSSLDPAIATVAGDGTVTSVGEFGSTLVAASYGDLTPAVANVVIAELTPIARLIHSDDVVSLADDESRVVLAANDNTTGIISGNVVMSGDQGGVLVRVISVQESPAEVTLGTEPAVLTDFFRRLSLEIASPRVSYSDDFQQEEKGPLPSLTCDAITGQLDVQVTGLSVNPTFDMGFNLTYIVVADPADPNRGTVDEWQMWVSGELGLKVNLGTAKLGGSGKKECNGLGPKIPIVRVPLGGPVILGANIQPIWGVVGELAIEGVDIAIPGPRYDKTYFVAAGIGWTSSGGIETRFDSVESGPGIDPPQEIFDFQLRIKGKIEAYLGAIQSFTASIGPFAAIDLNISRVRGTAGLAFEFEPPLHGDPDWLGAHKDLYLGMSADLDPLLQEINLMNRILTKMGVRENLVSFDPKLAEIKVPFASVEPPVLDLSTASVSASSPTVELTATVTPTMTFLGVNEVKFLYYDPADPNSVGQIIGVSSIDSNNNQASYTWDAYEAIQASSAGSGSFHVKATTGSLPGFFAMGSETKTITSGCSPAGPNNISVSLQGGINGALTLNAEREFFEDSPTQNRIRDFGPGLFGPHPVCGEIFYIITIDAEGLLNNIEITSNLTGTDGTVINMQSTEFLIDIDEWVVNGTWSIDEGPSMGTTGTFQWVGGA